MSTRTRVVAMGMLATAAIGAWAPGAGASPLFSKLPGELGVGRYAPAVALLPSGKVLVAGGFNQTAKYMKTAELYNPATGGFEPAADMTEERAEATTVALPGGKVLIAGGWGEAGGTGHPLRTAELFNPETGLFEKLTAEMTTERDGAGGALLANGEVLLTGGTEKGENAQKTAELYNPGTQTFHNLTGEMGIGRYQPAVVTLPSGKVLVAGGFNKASKPEYLKSAELFNPETSKFDPLEGPAHELIEARDEVGVTLLPSGKALIAGGYNGTYPKSLELFDPVTNAFETLPTQLTESRAAPGLVQFADGSLFVVGGTPNGVVQLRTAEQSQPVSATAAASGIGPSSATLNGLVLPEVANTAYFQYGTTTAYGSSTPHQPLAPSPSSQLVSAPIAALAPGTTYHYRIVDEQFATTYGADRTFTTPPAPGSPPLPPIVCCAAPPKPVISSARQTHSRWREGDKLVRIAKTKTPIGTVFSFTLNEPARVTLAFTQLASGRKVGARCVAQTKSNRRRPGCRHTLTVATLSFSGHAGTNRVSFQGRISRGMKLRPGTYTLLITASNAAGQRSAPARLTFTIVA